MTAAVGSANAGRSVEEATETIRSRGGERAVVRIGQLRDGLRRDQSDRTGSAPPRRRHRSGIHAADGLD